MTKEITRAFFAAQKKIDKLRQEIAALERENRYLLTGQQIMSLSRAQDLLFHTWHNIGDYVDGHKNQ